MGDYPADSDHQVYTEVEEVPFLYIKEVGKGAVGVVQLVKGTSGSFKGKRYARKVITLDNDEATRKKQLIAIEDEVKVLKETLHLHVVQLAKTYQYENNYAIVLDPLADGNLKSYLEPADGTPTPLTREFIPLWIGCLIAGVSYLHGKGIRHRDIKPENILIKDGRILFTDFGISMMGLGITVPTTIVARPRSRSVEYCAPEVEEGGTRRRSADIFSLGAVALEMLTAYSYPGKLVEFKNTLEYDRGKYSFGKKLDRLSQWIMAMDNAPAKGDWHSTVLSICKEALQQDRHLRPKADDIRSWLLRQKSTAQPPLNCDCHKLLDELYSTGNTAESLQRAYENGHRLMRDLFIEEGVLLNDKDAFVAACQGGLRDSVEYFLKERVDANTSPALQNAAGGGFTDIVQLLLDKGARANTPGALQKAAAGGFIDIVQILLDNGADAQAKDEEGFTAVELAAAGGHKKVVELLLDPTSFQDEW